MEALLFGALGCEFCKRCDIVLPVRCYRFSEEQRRCWYLTKHLERNEENVPKPVYVQVNASSAPAGDAVLFRLLLSSAVGGVRQGAAGAEHHWKLQGNPSPCTVCMQNRARTRWWSRLNFEIWACLKLKLESKPPGRKQCEPFFFFFLFLSGKP